MASSNRHWPSMFKSKPCTTTHHQWQHDLNSSLMSTGCNKQPYTPVPGCEERTPEPKPRWNPRPEQIRILESIFNSGMVNPPRDEIRKIRAQLQEYGQVGDANVFYWFQNRKSRSKHKLRQLQQHTKSQSQQQTISPPVTTKATTSLLAPSSSSSSSDKSSPNSIEKPFSIASSTVMDMSNSPTASVNQNSTFFQTPSEFLAEPFFFPVQQTQSGGSHAANLTQGFCFPDVPTDVSTVPDVNLNVVDHATVGNYPSLLLSELMLMNHGPQKKVEEEKTKLPQQLSYATTQTIAAPTSFAMQTLVNPIQDEPMGEVGPMKSTVFINDVCFEVAVGPLNIREAFGYDAVLINSAGQPVLTNEWGVTLQPLQHGAFYYLVRSFTPPEDRTIDLI